MPRGVSVAAVIPTFNGARYLAATIESVLAQAPAPEEVIVVDDGSVDDTPAVAARFLPRVRYVRSDTNHGICHARNHGIAASRSEWIALCDHDDLWVPGKLARQLDLVRRVPDVEFQFSDFVDVVGDRWTGRRKFLLVGDDYWAEGRRDLGDGIWLFETSLFPRLIRFQPVFPSTMMFSRALFERIGGFDEALGRERTEDLEFTLRAVTQTRVAAIAAPLVGKRDHGGGFSDDNLATALSHVRVLRHVLRHNPAASDHAAAINQEIARRSRDAANDAFARGDLPLAAELLRDVPASMRDARLWVKAAILRLPRFLAVPLGAALVGLQARSR